MNSSVARARVGVSLVFLANGALFSALLPRLPEIKYNLLLSDSQYGFVIAAFPVGAVLAAAFAGKLIRAIGSRVVMVLGSIGLASALVIAGVSPEVGLLVAALAAAGAVDALVDAAQNVQGLLVERALGRSVLNSMHAIWSLGAVLGVLGAAACVASGVGIGIQLSVSAVLWIGVVLLAGRLAGGWSFTGVRSGDTPRSVPDSVARGSRTPWLPVVLLGVLAIAGTSVEEVADSWAVLFLRREASAPVGVAVVALSLVLLSQFTGRLVSDRLTDRWGRSRVVRLGGAIVVVGMAVLAWSPSLKPAMLGFALCGLGSAPVVPAALAAAGTLRGLREGSGIAIVGWMMRAGFLVTSPLVGAVSERHGLRVAMAVPLVAGVVIVVLAGTTRPDSLIASRRPAAGVGGQSARPTRRPR